MHPVDRRTALAAFAAVAGLAALGGCASPYAGRRLVIAAGVGAGVYFQIGGTLRDVWAEHLDVDPEVLTTAGSVDNLDRLAAAAADVAFTQVDTAAERLAGPADPRSPRALARLYDDALHVVVRRDSPLVDLAGLRGARVGVGTPISGYYVIARRVLETAGIDPDTGIVPLPIGLSDSIDALRTGAVDALFWSGGLPTAGITELAAALPIRLLDLGTLLEDVRKKYPVYSPGTVPASTYDIGDSVATLFVRNILVVPADLDDAFAAALVGSMFTEQARLAATSPAALTIDARSAIGTQPVPLHPGAEQFYREGKVT